MRVILTGKPGRYRKFHDLVVMTFEHNVDSMGLPKGIPAPSEEQKLHYTVYISHLQWRRIEKNLRKKRKPDLVIEGIVAHDEELNTLAVYTTRISISTAPQKPKKSEKDTRKQASSSRTSNRNDSKAPAKEMPQRHKISIPKPASTGPEFDMPEGVSSTDEAKLRQLHTAAAQFRKKIEGMEEKPENQRFGLDMTRKLLANTEKQIAVIEKKYQ